MREFLLRSTSPMLTTRIVLLAPMAMLACTEAIAQSPSVLDLQNAYHIGIYSIEVNTPGGAVTARSAEGTMSLNSAGLMTGTFSGVELTPSSATFSPQFWNATYAVHPNGEMVFDFNPTNPGTDLLAMWANTDGSVLHTTRQDSTAEAVTIIAIEKGVGLSTATLNGTYSISGHSVRFFNGVPNVLSNWGTISFDGLGTASYNQTLLLQTPTNTSTIPSVGSAPYSVGPDGRLNLNGAIGGVRADGEAWYVIFGDTLTGGTVQITAGVKIGASYNHNSLAGRHSVATTSLALGVGPSLPQCKTDYGELSLDATSASTGIFSSQGVTVSGTPSGVAVNSLAFSGTSNLLANGELNLNGAGRNLAVGFSSDGAFFTGREVGNTPNFVFGMRQCLVSSAYGSGTAGTGSITPTLGMKTFPILGNSGFQLIVNNAVGGGVGVVVLSAAPSPGLAALGGTILIDPLAIGYSATILLSGLPGVAGDGAQATAIPIPANPALNGFQMFAQGMILDPAGSAGFAMTNGFEIVICN
jgi:hypothetical protein